MKDSCLGQLWEQSVYLFFWVSIYLVFHKKQEGVCPTGKSDSS